MSDSTEMATAQPAPIESARTDSERNWNLMQRRAKALAASGLVPEVYQNNLPNVLVALDMADRLGANPLMVMQNLVIIHGRPSWSATFLIATVNQCGRFTPLRYETRGDDPRKTDFRCRAVARDIASGDVCEGEWIDWPMVDGEGWSKKSGSKWKTMPGQMFRYRAAAFWARTFAPEVSMGIYTEDEARDVAVEPLPVASVSPSQRLRQMIAAPAYDAETGEITEGAESSPQAPTPEAQTDAAPKADIPASGQAAKPTCPNPKCGKAVDAEMLAECNEKGTCPVCAPKPVEPTDGKLL